MSFICAQGGIDCVTDIDDDWLTTIDRCSLPVDEVKLKKYGEYKTENFNNSDIQGDRMMMKFMILARLMEL